MQGDTALSLGLSPDRTTPRNRKGLASPFLGFRDVCCVGSFVFKCKASIVASFHCRFPPLWRGPLIKIGHTSFMWHIHFKISDLLFHTGMCPRNLGQHKFQCLLHHRARITIPLLSLIGLRKGPDIRLFSAAMVISNYVDVLRNQYFLAQEKRDTSKS